MLTCDSHSDGKQPADRVGQLSDQQRLADGAVQVAAAEDQDALLLTWLDVVQRVVCFNAEEKGMKCLPKGADAAHGTGNSDASEVCRRLHYALEKLAAANQLETILATEAQLEAAAPVFSFIVEQIKASKAKTVTLAKDLALLLQVSLWRTFFTKNKFEGLLTDDCRLILASSDITLDTALTEESSERFSDFVFFTDDNHRDQARRIVGDALQQATNSLVAAGARILVLGDRGSGKSSVVNAAFGKALARAGPGRPVTECITLFEATETCPVHIYDSKGFESLTDNAEAIAQLRALVQERRDAQLAYSPDDPNAITEQLHAVWWVIDVLGGGRFNPELINKMVESTFSEARVPVFMILNKCDTEEDYVQGIQRDVNEHCIWAERVVKVVADARLGPMMHLCEQCNSPDILISSRKRSYKCENCGKNIFFKANYGIEDLIRLTAECLPTIVASSFLAAQKMWMEGLERQAVMVICGFSCSAAAASAFSLPLCDRFLLWPLQGAMVMTMAERYGVIISWKTAISFLLSFSSVFGLGFAGWLGSNFFKMLPGLSFAGATCNAFVSFVATGSIGCVTKALLKEVRGKAIVNIWDELTPADLAQIMSVEQRKNLFSEYFDQLAEPLGQVWDSGTAVDPESLQRVFETTGI